MKSAINVVKIVVLVTLAFLVIYNLRNFGHGVVAEELKRHTAIGVIFYFLFMTGSVVFVAVPAVPLWPVGILTFGFWPALILTILAINLGAWISFIIARIWGRGIVEKFIGKHMAEKNRTDKFISSPTKFFILRMIGNNAFDLVSYIGGLSRLDPMNYGLITLLTSTFWIGVSFFAIDKVLEINSKLVYVASLGAYLVVVAVGVWLLKQFSKKYNA